jgi:hypothetical protein
MLKALEVPMRSDHSPWKRLECSTHRHPRPAKAPPEIAQSGIGIFRAFMLDASDYVVEDAAALSDDLQHFVRLAPP